MHSTIQTQKNKQVVDDLAGVYSESVSTLLARIASVGGGTDLHKLGRCYMHDFLQYLFQDTLAKIILDYYCASNNSSRASVDEPVH